MNNVSRNTPIALVVGAAGFIGSSLVDKLLLKNIQVVGIDDLSYGRKENLAQALRNNHFNFFRGEDNPVFIENLPRLDYAFFIVTEDIPRQIFRSALENFLEGCEKYQPRILLVSSIELYDKQVEGLGNLREAEERLSRYAAERKANARVVRLAPVYGPRMHFRSDDPMIRLIQSAIWEKVQKEATPLDFSSRALYITDAVDLLIKTLMHGSTAQKIYDGALSHPVKIAEIKQVLLDPLWYENRGFTPTQLPPWLTPNLLKTQKELSWSARVDLVHALKETLHFFKENPGQAPREVRDEVTNKAEVVPEVKPEKEEKKPVVVPPKKRNFKKIKNYLGGLMGILIITFAFIYPVASYVFSANLISQSLEQTSQALLTGDFTRAQEENLKREKGVEVLQEESRFISIFENLGFLRDYLHKINLRSEAFAKASRAASSATEGEKALFEAVAVSNGEKEGDLKTIFESASAQFSEADQNLNLAHLANNNSSGGILNFDLKIDSLRNIVEGGKFLSHLLPSIVSLEGKKDYLMILEDNTTLRPSGGSVLAYAQVEFDKGKLISIKTGDINDLDKSFTDIIDPPRDLQTDLGVSNWRLKDFNIDPDFPTSAKRAQWFFAKEAGVETEGVITFDIEALSNILDQGGRSPAQYFKEALNMIFFAPKQSLPEMAQNLGKSLLQKHMLIYLSDPATYAYLNSLGLGGGTIRPGVEGTEDFLAFFETDLTKSGGSLKIDRMINLSSVLDNNKKLSHKLEIKYQNQAGDYGARWKVFLPSGTKLISASFGGEDILKSVSSFVDYGRSAYSLLLNLKPGESKTLKLEYQNQKTLEEKEGKINYKLVVVKQPGTDSDKFDFKMSLPAGWKVISPDSTFSTDLSQDREFEVVLGKN